MCFLLNQHEAFKVFIDFKQVLNFVSTIIIKFTSINY